MLARIAIAAVLATGCVDDTARPPGGGAGGGGGGNQPNPDQDAGTDGGFDGQITGTLCRLTDLRFFEVCGRVDLSGIDIGIRGSSASAVTDADGNFAIEAPDADTAILEVGFATDDVKSSIIEVGATSTNVLVPTVLLADYLELLDLLLVFEPDGTGSMAIYARDGAAAVPAVEVVPPSGSQAPFYDAGSGARVVPARPDRRRRRGLDLRGLGRGRGRGEPDRRRGCRGRADPADRRRRADLRRRPVFRLFGLKLGARLADSVSGLLFSNLVVLITNIFVIKA